MADQNFASFTDESSPALTDRVVGYRTAVAGGERRILLSAIRDLLLGDVTIDENRITGDFSNATHSERVLFLTSTANGNSRIGVIPNGTSNTSGFNMYGDSDPDNAPFGQFEHNGTGVVFNTNKTGAGASSAYYVWNFENTEAVRLTFARNLLIGTTSESGLSGAGNLKISGSFVTTGGIFGTTTNDDAAAGKVGEYTEALRLSGAALALSSSSFVNVTSISLTAGDWDIDGHVDFIISGSDLDYYGVGSSSISQVLGVDTGYIQQLKFLTGISGDERCNIPTQRYSLASTTTIYLVTQASFLNGSISAYGILRARRVR